MKISLYSFFILFGVVFTPITASFGQRSDDLGCRQAESTSSIQKCLKNKLEDAQERLKEAYKTLDNKFDDKEKSDELKELQTSWLKYRDDECMWEANQASTPGLKGINELSCMVRVSEDRADLLEITYMDIDPDVTRQYADISRWQNILTNDYQDTVWDFDSAASFDLQCGDTEEIIAQGHKFVQTEENKNLYQKNKILAVIVNPAIGRPDITTFDFKISEAEENKDDVNILCNEKIKLSFVENQEKVINEDQIENHDNNKGEEKTCQAVLTVEQGKCINKNILWDGKEFVLSNIKTEQNNDEEVKIENVKNDKNK